MSKIYDILKKLKSRGTETLIGQGLSVVLTDAIKSQYRYIRFEVWLGGDLLGSIIFPSQSNAISGTVQRRYYVGGYYSTTLNGYTSFYRVDGNNEYTVKPANYCVATNTTWRNDAELRIYGIK